MTSRGGQCVTEVSGGGGHIAAGEKHNGKPDELMLSNPYWSAHTVYLCGSFALPPPHSPGTLP